MKYIFLDIDGTLYSTKINAVPESAVKAIEMARKNGHKVYACTGRSLAECQMYLDYNVNGFIMAAGALIYDENKRIYDAPIDQEDLNELLGIFERYNIGFAAEGLAGAYFNEAGYSHVLAYFSPSTPDVEQQKKIAEATGFYPVSEWHEEEKIYKICVYHDSYEEFEEMRKLLPEKFTLTVTVRDQGLKEICGEITNKKINKSTGIKVILDKYGASFEDAIAIGDSGNDMEMIQDCGVGIAMGNAFDTLKSVADYVTTDILDDGIYNAFKKFGVI